jgi:hypothetical protein
MIDINNHYISLILNLYKCKTKFHSINEFKVCFKCIPNNFSLITTKKKGKQTLNNLKFDIIIN